MIRSPVMPSALGQHDQLGHRAAVRAESLLLQIFTMCGFGHALTAKCSRNPSAQEKALFSARAFSRIAFFVVDVKRRGMTC